MLTSASHCQPLESMVRLPYLGRVGRVALPWTSWTADEQPCFEQVGIVSLTWTACRWQSSTFSWTRSHPWTTCHWWLAIGDLLLIACRWRLAPDEQPWLGRLAIDLLPLTTYHWHAALLRTTCHWQAAINKQPLTSSL